MHTLHDGNSQASVGWGEHVLSSLLRPSAEVCAATAGRAGGHAGVHRQKARKPYEGASFAGPAGAGCALSMDEQLVLSSVFNEPMSWECAT